MSELMTINNNYYFYIKDHVSIYAESITHLGISNLCNISQIITSELNSDTLLHIFIDRKFSFWGKVNIRKVNVISNNIFKWQIFSKIVYISVGDFLLLIKI